MRILHIAPFNTAGVPFTLVQAERELGHISRLITLGRNPQSREEDICLDLPFLLSKPTQWIKTIVTPMERRRVPHQARIPKDIPVVWKAGTIEKELIRFRERIWKPRIDKILESIDFWNFDLYQLDGGLGFYRDASLIRRLKKAGKHIICCYTGSDLRTRGVIPGIDSICDLNITVEFDHLRFHNNIHHVPFPFNPVDFQSPESGMGKSLRIGHAPTHREAKGSQFIIPVVEDLEKEFDVKLVLIEGLNYQEALAMKSTCHIFIDQIGDLGFGMNSIEALAMGIPACSSLAPGYQKSYPGHPFIEINKINMKDQLIRLIEDIEFRKSAGIAGRKWVKIEHDPIRVVKRIHRLAGYGI
ncbi:hypothetical protein BVY01_04215 [bacterium I07]|nr:hypothetical protein BVY01_04215 [bacterium I07]